MRRLIINCDDYGWDVPATQAILELAAARRISSTTVMANLASDADLRALHAVLPNVSTGLHLNLIDGAPLSRASAVRTLVGPDGQFFTGQKLLARFLSGRVRIGELETEVGAQLARLGRFDIPVSHADSHQHQHLYPALGPVLTGILRRYGVRRLRRWSAQPGYALRGQLLNAFGVASRYGLRGFHSPNALVADFSAAQDATLPLFIRGLARAFYRGPLVEFMTHPGLANRAASYLNRVAEYEFWRDAAWPEYLAENKIRLVRYDEI